MKIPLHLSALDQLFPFSQHTTKKKQKAQQTMADLTPGPRKPVPAELTGFRSALAHTGIPHGVLLWKPRLPSRNWLIFWSVSLSLSYAYYYDRSECKRIKQEVVERVEKYGREPMPGGSLGEPRRVVVWAGRWGGDDDADRAGRYFRKYVKVSFVMALWQRRHC